MNVFQGGEFEDFSSMSLVPDLMLDGVTKKIPLRDTYGKLYMLKFSKEKGGISIPEHLLEYISCKIAKQLEYPVQEVELGIYEGNPCVKIRIFDQDLVTFGGLGVSTLDGREVWVCLRVS